MKSLGIIFIIGIILSFTFVGKVTNNNNRIITGNVVDSQTKEPLHNVKITAKGLNYHLLTDTTGYFELEVPDSCTALLLYHKAFKLKEIPLPDNNGELMMERNLYSYDDFINPSFISQYGTYALRWTVTNGVACQSTDNVTIYFNEKPTVNAGNNSAICDTKTINLSATPSVGIGTWTTTSGQNNNFTHSLPVEANTESYDPIVENEFKDALQNPLSTFAADVDNASYSNVRRFLRQNELPDMGAVRIEEMINYFNYNYPAPQKNKPFSITTEMGDCPWNKTHYLLHVGIKGKEIEMENLAASNIVFLLDVSGSMSEDNKLGLVKKSLNILTQQLRADDNVSIVVYAGAAGQVLAPTKGDKKSEIIAALENLEAGGSTAGGQGIELAYKVAKENFIAGGNNRVVLCTDGDFNVGVSSDAELVNLIEEKRKENIFLTVLGYGMGNYKDSKLEKLSNAGNGNYAYIDNINEANRVLGKEFFGTIYVIAKDVKFQLEFNPAKVKAYRLIGYENRLLAAEDFNNDVIDAGEIGSGHTVTALYEIVPAQSTEKVRKVDELEYQKTTLSKSDNLFTLKLRYKEPTGNKSKLIEQRLKHTDLKHTQLSENFMLSASIAQFAMLLGNSNHKGNTTYSNLYKQAKILNIPNCTEDIAELSQMIETARLLEEYKIALSTIKE